MGMPTSASEADAILICGGDGTVHRHLPQLVPLQIPVLVVPTGSGNDFARALNLRSVRDSLNAWKRFCCSTGNVKTIDLGIITSLPKPAEAALPPSKPPTPLDSETRYTLPGTRYYFCCIAGCGLDGEVACRVNHLPRWLRAHGGYVLTLPAALLRFSPPRIKLSLSNSDRDAQFTLHSDKPATVIAFANTPTYGGGMRIAPRAQLDDGKLDVCLVDRINKLKLLRLFPTVYSGQHLSLPMVEYFQAERLRLETEHPLDVYADGEYVCRTPVEIGLALQALRVIVPTP
jgi:diacylglycerol kinase (ATP)